MNCSLLGKNFIKQQEGLRLRPYFDQKGVLSVGYGHIASNIIKNKEYSKLECEQLLEQDIESVVNCLNSFLTIPLNQNQFDALISFIFNIGCCAFKESSLLRRLNNGETPSIVIRYELLRWVYEKKDGIKKEDKGLLHRRLSEIELFNRPIPENLEDIL